jgi:hypothetical protein
LTRASISTTKIVTIARPHARAQIQMERHEKTKTTRSLSVPLRTLVHILTTARSRPSRGPDFHVRYLPRPTLLTLAGYGRQWTLYGARRNLKTRSPNKDLWDTLLSLIQIALHMGRLNVISSFSNAMFSPSMDSRWTTLQTQSFGEPYHPFPDYAARDRNSKTVFLHSQLSKDYSAASSWVCYLRGQTTSLGGHISSALLKETTYRQTQPRVFYEIVLDQVADHQSRAEIQPSFPN